MLRLHSENAQAGTTSTASASSSFSGWTHHSKWTYMAWFRTIDEASAGDELAHVYRRSGDTATEAHE